MRESVAEINSLVAKIKKKDLPSHITDIHIITIALSMSIAYRLTLPSAVVNNVKTEYVIQHVNAVEELVSMVNENHMPVDFLETMKMVKSIWLMRYSMLHVPQSTAAMSATTYALSNDELTLSEHYRSIMTNQDNTNVLMAHVIRAMSSGINNMLPARA